ncbi:MAG: hypothetical protein NVS2B9_06270 [Myxococcales bacterium]
MARVGEQREAVREVPAQALGHHPRDRDDKRKGELPHLPGAERPRARSGASALPRVMVWPVGVVQVLVRHVAAMITVAALLRKGQLAPSVHPRDALVFRA